MLVSLSTIFTGMATSSTVLAADQQQHVAQRLEEDAQLMSDARLAELITGQPEQTQNEIIRINTAARPLALQIALTVPILASLTGLITSYRMIRIPDPKSASTGEGSVVG